MDLPPESRALILQYYRYKAINDTYKQVQSFRKRTEKLQEARILDTLNETHQQNPVSEIVGKNQRYKLKEKDLQTKLTLQPPLAATEEPKVTSEPSVKVTELTESNLKHDTLNSLMSHPSPTHRAGYFAQLND